jgi:hypothetical protein
VTRKTYITYGLLKTVIALFSISFAYSNDQINLLTIVSTSCPEDTFPRHYTAANEIYKFAIKNQYIPKIATQEPRSRAVWRIAGQYPVVELNPPIDSQFKSAEDISRIVREPEFQKSSSTLIVIVGHGGAP